MEIKIPIVIDDKALEEAIDKRVAELKQDGDFVLVTRCKDCKYYNPNYSRFDSDIPYNRCEHPAQQFDIECYDMWLETNPDDFCSYAEPKEIEGEQGMNEIAVFSICFNYALTAFNICFSLYMKKKGSSLWWTNIPVAVFCFCLATSRIFML